MRKSQLLAFSVGLIFALFGPLANAQHLRGSSHAPTLINQPVDENQRITLHGNVRPEVKPEHDRGRSPNHLMLEHMLLQLKRSPEQEQALEQFLQDLQTPGSPDYQNWLSAEEFGQRFGVASADMDKVTDWMEKHGLTINVVYPSNMVIDFSGTVRQVNETFHTHIHQLRVHGQDHIGNINDPQIPQAFGKVVAGVVSLNDFPPHNMHLMRKNFTFPDGFGGTSLALAPADLATIYNINPLFASGLAGQGQTIVVIEDTDVFSAADWTAFRAAFGLSKYTSGSFKTTYPSPATGVNNCKKPGVVPLNDAEAILDAEWATAAAPGAAIVMATCADTGTTFGGLIALQNLINGRNQPPAIMSISYGQCETENGAAANAAYNSAYQQAVAEGVSVFVAAGDSGAAGCDNSASEATHGIGVNAFASTPYNVAVGGTDFSDTFSGTNSSYWSQTNTSTFGSALSYIPEIPWNDSCAGALFSSFEGFGFTYGPNSLCNDPTLGSFTLSTVAGGGGPSACATGSPSTPGVVGGSCKGWQKPSWQSVFGNPSDGVRDTPDISLFAADGLWSHYYIFCWSDTVNGGAPCSGDPSGWSGAGGTSFASPIMAGIQALANQKAGGRQGNPNPTYYQLAANEYNTTNLVACNSSNGTSVPASCVFYDVTEGDMDVNCIGNANCFLGGAPEGVLSTSNNSFQPAYPATSGWDFATGIGTLNAANLVNNWPGSKPTFTLSTTVSSLTLPQNGSATTTVTVVPFNGFTGTVSLAASGLPAGVTASFNPSSTTTSSTLKLSATASAALTTFSATITGTSGSLRATTTLSVTVIPPVAYLLSASPASLNVVQGASANSTITVAPQNGFSGSVTLTASGLPAGVTASFSPASTTSTSTMTVSANSTAPAGTYSITVTGTSGSFTSSTTVSVTVTLAPTYTVSASPSSVTVIQGASATSTIAVAPQNGFTGTVSFTASGVPAGVTASFNPSSSTSSSTLTFTAATTAAAGTYSVNVTGTSGTLTSNVLISLTVAPPPNFTLSAAPSNLTVVQGATANSAISVVPVNGFSDGVTLSTSALPSGVTASFNPASATTSSTLTFTASSTAAPGSYSVTVTGTSGSLTRTVTINLTVALPPSFTLSANPTSITLVQGSSASSLITVAQQNGFSGTVDLSASGMPAGVTASFSNPSTSGASNLTLTASNTAALGPATVTITGTSGNLIQTVTIALTVAAPPSYTLSATPNTLTVFQGASSTSTIAVSPQNGFNGLVGFAASGAPTGVSASFNPSGSASSTTMTVIANSNAPLGTFNLVVTGTSSSLSSSVTVSVTIVAPPTFALSASPSSMSLLQGNSGTSTISIVPQNGFNSSVALTASGLPSGVTASFSPANTSGTSTLTLTASSSAATGPFNVNITGTSGGLASTTVIALTVAVPPSFTLTSSNNLNIAQGSSGNTTITVNPQNGFNGSVTLSVSGLPAGVTSSFNPASTSTTSVLTLTASSAAAAGTYSLTVTGTSGSLTSTVNITLALALPPSFALSANPNSINLLQGASASSLITVAQQNGFSGTVDLSASGMPNGVTASFSNPSTTGASNLTLTATGTAVLGSATITVTGTSGTLVSSTVITLTVAAPPSFTLSASPNTVNVVQGSSANSAISILPQSGFSGAVTFSAAGLPAGATVSFNPASAVTSSTATFSTASTTVPGTYSITVTGTSGSLTSTVTISLVVALPPSFTLAANPNSINLLQGASATSLITVAQQNGFSGTVNLSASGMPSGVTASFSNPATTGASTLTVTADSSAPAGTFSIVVTGTSGSLSSSVTVTTTIAPPPSFSLSASPSSLSLQGNSGTSTISIIPQNGFSGSVALTASNLPTGVTASFSPSSTSGTSTLTLTASASAANGSFSVTVNGTSGSLVGSTVIALTVTTPPGFGLSATPTTVNVVQGSSANSAISVLPQSGFSGSVTFSASGLPGGVTVSFTPISSMTSTAATFATDSTTVPGNYPITITGTSGSVTGTVSVTLAVSAPPSFTLSASATRVTLSQGSGSTVLISVRQQNGFTGSVTLSASGMPAGVTASFSNPVTTGASALNLSASANATLGPATITVTGTSGSLTSTVTIDLTVSP